MRVVASNAISISIKETFALVIFLIMVRVLYYVLGSIYSMIYQMHLIILIVSLNESMTFQTVELLLSKESPSSTKENANNIVRWIYGIDNYPLWSAL